MLPPLSPFARAYYAYQRRLARALAQPTEVSTSWFFKQGSTAETAFQKFDEGVMKRERGDEKEEEAFEMARDEVAGASQVVKRSQEGDNDLKSLERRKERTVYLVVKKQGAWVFRKYLGSRLACDGFARQGRPRLYAGNSIRHLSTSQPKASSTPASRSSKPPSAKFSPSAAPTSTSGQSAKSPPGPSPPPPPPPQKAQRPRPPRQQAARRSSSRCASSAARSSRPPRAPTLRG